MGVPAVVRAACRVCFGVGVVVGRRVLPAGVVGVSGSSSVGSAALGPAGRRSVVFCSCEVVKCRCRWFRWRLRWPFPLWGF